MQAKLALLGLAASANALLFPRQMARLSPECTSAVKSIVSSIPTPTGALYSAILDGQVSTSGGCTLVAAASVTKDLSSYVEQAKSWILTESSDLVALQTKCPEISSLPIEQPPATCTNLVITTPGSSSGSSGNSGSSGSSGKSAGARSEVAIGAVLAAGLLGVMAL